MSQPGGQHVQRVAMTTRLPGLAPLTPLQAEQVWLMQAVPDEPQSVSVQQLPVVQLPPQQ